MVKDKQKRMDPAAMGAGDSQIDLAPPNAEHTQPLGGAAQPASEPAAPALAEGDAVAGASSAPETLAPEPAAAADGAADLRAAVLDEELDGLRRDLNDATDRHLRLAAEFDNYRKRVERERSDLWSRAQAEIAGRLLDTLDDLERVAHHSESATAEALHEGVQLIERKLRNVLAAAGLEEIAAENASFDPQVMEAVAVVPTESPEDDDVVSDVFQRGYRFKGQLLRAARVRVKKHG